MSEGIQNAQRAGVEGPPWTKFEQITGIESYAEHISAEDLSILAVSDGFDLIQEISETNEGHNSFIKALSHVFIMRDKLAELIPPNTIQGRVASFEGVLTPEARLLMINLNTLSENILKSLNELKVDANSIGPLLHVHLKKVLRAKKFPSIVPIDITGAATNPDPPEPPHRAA